MQRSFEEEILDVGGLPPEVLERAHRRLSQTHSLLGNHAAILRALRCDGAARRVLDIGCGHGGLLKKVRRQMGVEVLGVDLRPPEGGAGEFPILKLDAVREALPRADVAVSVCLVHHLRDEEFVEMVRNVGRACPVRPRSREWIPRLPAVRPRARAGSDVGCDPVLTSFDLSFRGDYGFE